MALNIDNREVERLAKDLAQLTNCSETEVIRRALLEHRERVSPTAAGPSREDRLRQFLELRVWPLIPPQARIPWSKEQEEAALGYGKSGEPV
jgi:hypothetical protein